MAIRLIILGMVIVIVAVLITGCRNDRKQTDRPTPREVQQEAAQPEQEQPVTKPEGPQEPSKEESLISKPEPLPELPGFLSEADRIQQIWGEFQRERGKLKAKTDADLGVWVDRVIARLDWKKDKKDKEDPYFKDFMVGLLKTCLKDSQNPLCQAPWNMTRFVVPLFKEITADQQGSLRRRIEETLRKVDYVALTGEEVAHAATEAVALFSGEISCNSGICTFEEIFPKLDHLSADAKERLLADLLDIAEHQARIQRWQFGEESINVVIRVEGRS